MKPLYFLLPAALVLGACAGDNHTTQQSPEQPSRSVATGRATQGARAGAPGRSMFMRGRVYQITRLETSTQPRGEWRALGETIRQQGSFISFTEMGSGREVSFTAPHQITATSATSDRAGVQPGTDTPSDAASAPGTPRS